MLGRAGLSEAAALRTVFQPLEPTASGFHCRAGTVTPPQFRDQGSRLQVFEFLQKVSMFATALRSVAGRSNASLSRLRLGWKNSWRSSVL